MSAAPGLLVAWLITVAVEAPCVGAFYPGRRIRMALVCALTTSATNPAMNLLLPQWLGTGKTFLIVGEARALLSEAAVYGAASRPRDLPRALVTVSALVSPPAVGLIGPGEHRVRSLATAS